MTMNQMAKIYNDPQRRKDYQAGVSAGIKAAASFISPWSGLPSKHRLDDLILCKFNQTKRRQPRRIRAQREGHSTL